MRYWKLCAVLLTGLLIAQGTWTVRDPGFRALAVAGSPRGLWAAGPSEFIALSTDDGQHWTNKHSLIGGGTLLNIAFPNAKFGLATGTGGVLLTTEDGGDTWQSHPKSPEAILQSSFSDARHGIVRTRTSLLMTKDGGETWAPAMSGEASQTLKEFRSPDYIVAVDADHMLVLLLGYVEKNIAGRVLATTDGGATWRQTSIGIDHTNIHGVVGDSGGYYAYVGQMVDLDHQGGHPVYRGFRSADGFTWKDAPPISGCQWHGCSSCTAQGCLAANGLIVRTTGEATVYDSFPPNPELTSKWAATETGLCFAGVQLQCAPLHRESRDTSHDVEGNPPGPLLPPALNSPAGLPNCLICALESVYIEGKGIKKATLKLVVHIGADGLVQEVEIAGAPYPAIEARVRRQVMGWLFDAYRKDGVAVNWNLRVSQNIVALGPS